MPHKIDNDAVVYVTMAMETNIGIICGCLPGCKPLMSRIFPKLFRSTEGSSNPQLRNRVRPPNSASFPLKILHGGTVKEQGCTVSYNRGSDITRNGVPGTVDHRDKINAE
jgi:hypothetical protein